MPAPLKLTFAEAKQRFDLAKRLSTWNERRFVALFEGNTAMRDCDLDVVGPCVVTGNLIVERDITGPEEGVFLVVLGRCEARNVILGGPQVWIEGDLVVRNGVLADCNHGALVVGGDLIARLICAEHVVQVGRSVRGATVDLGGLRVTTPGFAPTLSRKQVFEEAGQHFVPEALDENGHLSLALVSELMLSDTEVLREPSRI